MIDDGGKNISINLKNCQKVDYEENISVYVCTERERGRSECVREGKGGREREREREGERGRERGRERERETVRGSS